MHGALRKPAWNLLSSLFRAGQLPLIGGMRPRLEENAFNTANIKTATWTNSKKKNDKDSKGVAIVSKNKKGKVVYRIKSSLRKKLNLDAKVRHDRAHQNTSKSTDESQMPLITNETAGINSSNKPTSPVQLKGLTLTKIDMKEAMEMEQWRKQWRKEPTSNCTSNAKPKIMDPQSKIERSGVVNQNNPTASVKQESKKSAQKAVDKSSPGPNYGNEKKIMDLQSKIEKSRVVNRHDSTVSVKQESKKSGQKAVDKSSPSPKQGETVNQLTPRRVKFSSTEMVFTDKKTTQPFVTAKIVLSALPILKPDPLRPPIKDREPTVAAKETLGTKRMSNNATKVDDKKVEITRRDKLMSEPLLGKSNKPCPKVEELNNICVQALKKEAEVTDSKEHRFNTAVDLKTKNSTTSIVKEMPPQNNGTLNVRVDTSRVKTSEISSTVKLQKQSTSKTSKGTGESVAETGGKRLEGRKSIKSSISKKRRSRRSSVSKKLSEISADEAVKGSNKGEIKREKCLGKTDANRQNSLNIAVEPSAIGTSLVGAKQSPIPNSSLPHEEKINTIINTNGKSLKTTNKVKSTAVGSTTPSDKIKISANVSQIPQSKSIKPQDIPVDILLTGKQSKPTPVAANKTQEAGALNHGTKQKSVTRTTSPSNQQTVLKKESSEPNKSVAELEANSGLRRNPKQSMVMRYETQRNQRDRSVTKSRKDAANSRKVTKITFNPHIDTKPIIQSIAVIRSPEPTLDVNVSPVSFNSLSVPDSCERTNDEPINNNTSFDGKNARLPSTGVFEQPESTAKVAPTGAITPPEVIKSAVPLDSSSNEAKLNLFNAAQSTTKPSVPSSSGPTRVEHVRFEKPDPTRETEQVDILQSSQSSATKRLPTKDEQSSGSVQVKTSPMPKAVIPPFQTKNNGVAHLLNSFDSTRKDNQPDTVAKPENTNYKEPDDSVKILPKTSKPSSSLKHSTFTLQSNNGQEEGYLSIKQSVSFSSPREVISSTCIPTRKPVFPPECRKINREEGDASMKSFLNQTSPTCSPTYKPQCPPSCKSSLMNCEGKESVSRSVPISSICSPTCKPQFPPPYKSSCGDSNSCAPTGSSCSSSRQSVSSSCIPSCKPFFPPTCSNIRSQPINQIDSHRSFKPSLAFTSPCEGTSTTCAPSCKPTFPPQCTSSTCVNTPSCPSFSSNSQACTPPCEPFSFACCPPCQPQCQPRNPNQGSAECQSMETEPECNSCYKVYTKSATHSIRDVQNMPRSPCPIPLNCKPKAKPSFPPKSKYADTCCPPQQENTFCQECVEPVNNQVRTTQAGLLRALIQSAKLTSSYVTSVTGSAKSVIEWFLLLIKNGVFKVYQRRLSGGQPVQTSTKEAAPNIIKSGVAFPKTAHRKTKHPDTPSFAPRYRMKPTPKNQVKKTMNVSHKARIVRSVRKPVHDDRCKRTVAQEERRRRDSIGTKASPALAYSEVLNIVFSRRK